jgi:predicted dehydrogenase
MKQRVIHVGIGSFGKRWCREFLRANVDDGTIEVVALVDLDPKALAYGAQVLGLPDSACFTDPHKAFATVPADFCTVVVPPNYHEAIVDIAIGHGVDVLSEKPIADTMAGSVRIAQKIKAAGRKMAVTMSHRFDQDHRMPLSIGHASAHGVGCAVSPHDGRPDADRRRDPPSGHRCRSGGR